MTQAINDVVESAYRAGGAKVADVESTFRTTDLTTTEDVPGFGPSVKKAYLPLVR